MLLKIGSELINLKGVKSVLLNLKTKQIFVYYENDEYVEVACPRVEDLIVELVDPHKVKPTVLERGRVK
jgi:hypothetical protein